MLTEIRWQREVELMQENFPAFSWFAEAPWFGFQGRLKGPRSGRLYEVVLEGREDLYPETYPSTYIDPSIGGNWRANRNGRSQSELCVVKTWLPSRSTFANTLLDVIKYLEEHRA